MFMNHKNYEKKYSLYLSIIAIIALYILIFFLYWNTTISKYLTIQGVFNDSNIIEVFVLKSDYKLIIQNSTLFLDHKKYSYKIDDVSKMTLNGKIYYSLKLSIKGKTKYHLGDVSSIRLFLNKEKFIHVFEVIWKDDLDGKIK